MRFTPPRRAKRRIAGLVIPKQQRINRDKKYSFNVHLWWTWIIGDDSLLTLLRGTYGTLLSTLRSKETSLLSSHIIPSLLTSFPSAERGRPLSVDAERSLRWSLWKPNWRFLVIGLVKRGDSCYSFIYLEYYLEVLYDDVWHHLCQDLFHLEKKEIKVG